MAVKEEMNKDTTNNMNCSLCTKFIKILKQQKSEVESELKCDECDLHRISSRIVLPKMTKLTDV